MGSEQMQGTDEKLAPVRQRLELLLKERRYEEALDLLDETRWALPEVLELSRGIKLLKERLLRRYAHRLGDLDQTPYIAAAEDDLAWLELNEGERAIARLVDGIASYADLLRESRLGRFDTYRALDHLLRIGVVRTEAPPPPRPAGTVPEPLPEPRRPQLAQALLLLVSVLALVLLLWPLPAPMPLRIPESTTAVPALGPGVRAPAHAAPAPEGPVEPPVPYGPVEPPVHYGPVEPH